MIEDVDINTLTLEQYFVLIQGNQAPGMVQAEFGRMMEKDIEDMTFTKYIEYEAEMKRYGPLEEDIDYILGDESESCQQRVINHMDGNKPFTPKPQPEYGELSFDNK
nr:hypothetical protein [Tanacetum cinerariifolium]